MQIATSDTPACEHCHFYQEHNSGLGACHRYPPTFAGDGTPNEKHRWKHPLVQQHSWCGEFRPRVSH